MAVCSSARVVPAVAVGERATIVQLLGDVRVAAVGGRRRRAGFYSEIRREVPIRTFNDWKSPPPGFCEIDMVAHSERNTPRSVDGSGHMGLDPATALPAVFAPKPMSISQTTADRHPRVTFSSEAIRGDDFERRLTQHGSAGVNSDAHARRALGGVVARCGSLAVNLRIGG